jgi:hypothetical protein
MKQVFRLSWVILLVFFYSCSRGYYIQLADTGAVSYVYRINKVANRVVYYQSLKNGVVDTIGFDRLSYYGKRSLGDYISRHRRHRSADNYTTDYSASYRRKSRGVPAVKSYKPRGRIYVRSHTRRLKSGKVVTVRSHTRRSKK